MGDAMSPTFFFFKAAIVGDGAQILNGSIDHRFALFIAREACKRSTRDTSAKVSAAKGFPKSAFAAGFSIGELFEQLLFNLANADGIKFVTHPK